MLQGELTLASFFVAESVALTPQDKCLKFMSWNINSANNIKPYVKSCINSCAPDIIFLQEPRIAVQLPSFTALLSKQKVKVNSCIMINNRIEFKQLVCSPNVVAAEIRLSNNQRALAISLYLANPLDEESKYCFQAALDLIIRALDQRITVICAGDFNITRLNQKFQKLNKILSFYVQASMPVKRAGGFSRSVDFIMSNVEMISKQYPKALLQVSDHHPIFISIRKIRYFVKNKTIPCDWKFKKQWQMSMDDDCLPQTWRKLLSSSDLRCNELKLHCYQHQDWQKSLDQLIKDYLESYSKELDNLAGTFFSQLDRKDWFDRLRRLTGYNKYQNRDGSIATCCWVDDRICVGKNFNNKVIKWYQSISGGGPVLQKTQFPMLNYNQIDVIKLVRSANRFRKAISIDCVNSLPFELSESISQCCKSQICPRHLLWRTKLQFIFSKQFWNMAESEKCLIGRVVLLNKDHPQIPALGRFRPIRIASNVVKLLQCYLLDDLKAWSKKKLKLQYGFVSGVGCQVARHEVFSKMYDAINVSQQLWVVQIDLSNAYNTVNLVILEKLICRENFWSKQKIQLWKFLASNAKTFINGKAVKQSYGVAQGSLLSPLLFNLYMNDLLDELKNVVDSFVRAYADDIIILSRNLKSLEECIKILFRFCTQRYLKVNVGKSQILRMRTGFKYGKLSFDNVQGIPIRNQAKYLGVMYNTSLNLRFSINGFKKKQNFIFSKFYRLLKKSNFRQRYVLWMIFISPYYRMCSSICGPALSHRAKVNFEFYKQKVRSSLKRFCLIPQAAISKLFDVMSKCQESILSQRQKKWEQVASKHTQCVALRDQQQYIKYQYQSVEPITIKKFHSRIDQLLRTINCCYCAVHSGDLLTVAHLKDKHMIIVENQGLYSENKDSDVDSKINVNQIIKLKGQNRWKARDRGQKSLA